MRRRQLIEIEDQPWCPAAIRDALTDFLQFSVSVNKPYTPIVPRLVAALDRTVSTQVVDLCSGAGGPWLQLQRDFAALGAQPVVVCLTDRYPNVAALQRVVAAGDGAITFVPDPVDATGVPPTLAGFRTLFAGFHHFPPADARRIIADAVARGQGIGIFEATKRSRSAIALMCIIPLVILFTTPLIRPFRWSRLVLTYLLPVIPLIAWFDGVVSCIRTYSPDDLRDMVAGLGDHTYVWEIGEERSSRSPVPVTYLIGYPRQSGTAG